MLNKLNHQTRFSGMMSKIFHLILLSSVIFIAGCISQSPENLALSNPIVKEFLTQYPNAELKITFFSQSQVQNIIESVREDCDNPYLEAKDYYKISIEEKNSGLSVLSWLDWNNKTVACAVKKAIENPSIGQPPTQESPPTLEVPIETPTQSPTPTPIGSCTSCDDNNKCTFDYCNEYTSYECRHKDVSPCYNDKKCEELETNLPIGPSCPNLGWVSSGKAGSSASKSTPAEEGYYAYKSKVNSGQNNDCPATCDDGNTNTSDYFNFTSQKCGHYDCYGSSDKTPPIITVIEPKNESTISTQSTTLKVETNENSKCQYSIGAYSSSVAYGVSVYKPMQITGSLTHTQPLDNLSNGNQVYISCTDNSNNKKEIKIIFYVKGQSLYPKWENDQVSITPTNLSSNGGTVEATIATQDDASPSITSIKFTLYRPDGTTETKTATGTCAVAYHTSYTSKCWKVVFNIPANSGNTTQTYTVKVSSSNIVGTRSGYFTVAAPDMPGVDIPFITVNKSSFGGNNKVKTLVKTEENSTYIEVHMGEAGGGDSIQIKSVKEHSDKVIVYVERLHPGLGCFSAAVLTYPFHVIKLSILLNKPVYFEYYDLTNDC